MLGQPAVGRFGTPYTTGSVRSLGRRARKASKIAPRLADAQVLETSTGSSGSAAGSIAASCDPAAPGLASRSGIGHLLSDRPLNSAYRDASRDGDVCHWTSSPRTLGGVDPGRSSRRAAALAPHGLTLQPENTGGWTVGVRYSPSGARFAPEAPFLSGAPAGSSKASLDQSAESSRFKSRLPDRAAPSRSGSSANQPIASLTRLFGLSDSEVRQFHEDARADLHDRLPGAVRVSCNPSTPLADVAALVEALRAITATPEQARGSACRQERR